jgi:Ca2+-binding RTX toxin-like protein
MDVRGRTGRRITAVLTGTALSGGMLFVATPPAHAATTASFVAGSALLTVIGDNADNTITISREPAGSRIVVNGGAVPISGGTPTVANTSLIQIFGLGGNDILTLSEANGALPRGNLFGGSDADTLTGGSGADQLFGQSGNDAIFGSGGTDILFGGDDADSLTGGDADDQAFGEKGNDRMTWNNGDDTDLNEGGEGTDRVQVNGSAGAESFTAVANGVRTRLDRVGPSPFSIDIGTSERLSLNTGDGQDRFDASGVPAGHIAISVSTGAENDAVTGSGGDDVIDAGAGTDVVDGQAGDDQVFLGDGADIADWNPGDGNDSIEGDAGSDRLVFLGSSANERFDLAADNNQVQLTRDVDAVEITLDELEVLRLRASGGADTVTVHDVSGTDLTDVEANLAVVQTGLPDGLRDTVRVEGTPADDTVRATGTVGFQQVNGAGPRISLLGADSAPVDRISFAAGAGNDLVDASQLAAPAGVVIDGANGDDVLIGSEGDDVIFGGEGNDALVGRAGTDTLNGGPGDDVLLGGEILTDGLIPTKAWLAGHVTTVDGNAVIDLGRTRLVVPGIPAESLQ